LNSEVNGTMPQNWKKNNGAQMPYLDQDETIVWSNISKAGILNRRVSQIMAITQSSIIFSQENCIPAKYPLSYLDDVLVVDTNSRGTGSHVTVGVGGYYSRSYIGTSKFQSHSSGTLLFMHNGVPFLKWDMIQDPHNLANLVKYEKKQQQNVTSGMDWISRPN
jgi:hypothetical protein